MRYPILILILLAAATACARPGADPLAPGAALSAATTGSAVLDDDLGRWPADPLQFESVRVVGDTLVARVSFGGGCREHRFALVFATYFMESMPVQMRGVLSHDAAGDPCRALLGRELRFDLSPLKERYRVSYGRQSSTIVLRGNWPGTLEYRF
jgi:hypothetical protein